MITFQEYDYFVRRGLEGRGSEAVGEKCRERGFQEDRRRRERF